MMLRIYYSIFIILTFTAITTTVLAGPTDGPTWKVPGAPNDKKKNCGFHVLPNDNIHMKATEVYHASSKIGAYNHAVVIDYHDNNFLLTWKNSPKDEGYARLKNIIFLIH